MPRFLRRPRPAQVGTPPAVPNADVLLLFDIDGTLLDARGAGRRALERAVAEWSGRSLRAIRVELGGRTDLGIFRELVTRLGLDYPAPAVRRTVLRRYLAHLDAELAQCTPLVHPGVIALLEHCRRPAAEVGVDGPTYHLGLVTGNVLPGACRKLAAAGLLDSFSFGAFGSDHEDRNLLVPVALDRWSRVHGRPASPARAVVIGDTHNDLDCARAAGSSALIVGTGFGDFATLAPLADAAFADLADTREVLRTIATLTQPVA